MPYLTEQEEDSYSDERSVLGSFAPLAFTPLAGLKPMTVPTFPMDKMNATFALPAPTQAEAVGANATWAQLGKEEDMAGPRMSLFATLLRSLEAEYDVLSSRCERLQHENANLRARGSAEDCPAGFGERHAERPEDNAHLVASKEPVPRPTNGTSPCLEALDEDPVQAAPSHDADAQRRLVVHVLSARGLRNADSASLGKSDPYCTVELEGVTEKRTNVRSDSLDPFWDEEIYFPTYDIGKSLIFKVWDKDIDRDDFLGQVTLDSDRFWPDGSGELPLTLTLTETGQSTPATLEIRVLSECESAAYHCEGEVGCARSMKSKRKTSVSRAPLFGSLNADGNSLDQEAYDVSMYYYDTGLCQTIARSDQFQNLTLIVIAVNTIYIGVDADRNPANDGADSTPLVFLVCDFIFCFFFSFEWLARFGSFRRKIDSLKDTWFKFDTALVALMVWETWTMPLLVHWRIFGKPSGAGPVGMIKMLRLLRLARMARLMRAFPELIAMIKGVRVAAKAVGSALLMLLLLIYTFAIIMFIQLRGNNIAKIGTKFETLGNAMWTMLCDGVFLDSFGTVSFALLDADHYLEVAILVLFVLASNLTVMNMLIGVLCEVVSQVAAAEKEDSAIKLMKETLLVMLKHLDEDNSGMISKHEISKVLDDVDAQFVLSSLAVNVNSLIEQLDMQFSTSFEISISEIMNFILMLRGDRQVTVKDVTHGQSVTRWRLKEVRSEIDVLHTKLDSLMGDMGVIRQENETASRHMQAWAQNFRDPLLKRL